MQAAPAIPNTDHNRWTWDIPQQLIDEGAHPNIPLIELLDICVRTRHIVDFDVDKRRVTFENILIMFPRQADA